MILMTFSINTFSQINWQRTYTPDGKISISFPGVSTIIPNPETGTNTYTFIKDNSFFVFAVDNYANVVKDQSLDNIHDKSLKESLYDGFFAPYGGNLISDNNIFYKGERAVDFYMSIQIPNSLIKYAKGRVLLENNLLIIAIYYYAVFNKNDFEKFINSLDF